MSSQTISPEAFVRRIRAAITGKGGDVNVAPGVTASFDGHQLRFAHVNADGDELVTESLHLSPSITRELSTRHNRVPLSRNARSRFDSVTQALNGKKFRGDFPFRPLVGRCTTPIARPAQSPAAVAVAV